MATYPRHKKARMIRDFMIEKDIVKLFNEDEKNDNVFFRTAYPMQGDNKQVVINIDDSVYLGVQILMAQSVPEEKRAGLLELLNQLDLEMPTVKYVLTKDNAIVTSMFFTADETNFNGALIMTVILNLLKTVSEKHYGRIKEFLAQ